jgi:hypothetical protein
MSSILVQSREAAPRLNGARLQRAPRVVPSTFDATPRVTTLPQMPVGLANPAGELSPRISVGARLSIGSLLYLGSVGLIAAGIVAVFFGTGFSLLVPTAGEPISGSANRAGSEATSPLPSHGNVEQQTFFARASASENKKAALNSAAFPALAEAPAIDGKDDVPHVDEVLASKAPPDTPAAPANAPVPASNSPAETAPAPPTPGLSKTEIAELLGHGDSLLRNGDVASARLFYERAAGAGDGRAALRLGATFDPEFLGRLGLGKMQANPAEARLWYSRARDLGVVDPKRRPNSVETSRGNSLQ